MIILPYSTALSLARRPLMSYFMAALLTGIFLLQLNSSITSGWMYYPDSWNPFTMVSSSLLHADWMHLIGNLIFFIAFAPALELLIDSRPRYLLFMLLVSLAVGISYSISVLIGASSNLPSLGFSGVVMGFIGLSAYLMPRARIRVFVWYYIGWKIVYAPAWLLALIYLGLDAWTMVTATDYGGINVVAHVMGGVAGYLYGYLRMQERRDETREELAEEIQAMGLQQKFGRDRAEAFRASKRLQQQQNERSARLEQDRFMRRVHQLVTTDRDAEATLALLERYQGAAVHELTAIFERVKSWGPSRTVLCLGRYIIDQLDRDKRYGKAIVHIEQCQTISPQFVLADISRTLFYAQFAIEANRPQVARQLLSHATQRYSGLISVDSCKHLLRRAK
jgi:membrane associated rhomboid family serine protease